MKPLATPTTTFGDLAREGLGIEVACTDCGHKQIVEGGTLDLHDRLVSGARFRCACGAVGLPTIRRLGERLWSRRLIAEAEQLKG